MDETQATPKVVAAVMALVMALIVGLVLFASFVGGWKSTPPDKVALHYTGGPFQGVHFVEVVAPGKSIKFYGLREKFYKYPATQRNYIVSDRAEEGDRKEADRIKTVSADNLGAWWNVAITFKLNTSPDVVKRFHEQLGLKFNAWGEKGWDHLLDQTLRQVLDNRMAAEASKYPLEKLYSDPTTRSAIQSAVGADLKNGVNDLVGGNFFCGPTFDREHPNVCPDLKFIIKGAPTIPDGIKAQFDANRQAALAVQQKNSEVEQAKKQAEAAAALNAAIANNPNYVLLKAIESGKITFWVLPQGSNYTLQGPAK